jgi:hypothetical protein
LANVAANKAINAFLKAKKSGDKAFFEDVKENIVFALTTLQKVLTGAQARQLANFVNVDIDNIAPDKQRAQSLYEQEQLGGRVKIKLDKKQEGFVNRYAKKACADLELAKENAVNKTNATEAMQLLNVKFDEIMNSIRVKINESENGDLLFSAIKQKVEACKESNVVEIIEHFNTKKSSINKATLSKLADIRDELRFNGAFKEARYLNNTIRRLAKYESAKWESEGDTEQSKRYDSEYHHELQVRNPKVTGKDTDDREGVKQSHVHAQQSGVNTVGLSTRYCPEHAGVSLRRVAESVYQCSLDGNMYNWELGWKNAEGEKVPGGSVALQTPNSTGYAVPHRLFDSRPDVENRYKK